MLKAAGARGIWESIGKRAREWELIWHIYPLKRGERDHPSAEKFYVVSYGRLVLQNLIKKNRTAAFTPPSAVTSLWTSYSVNCGFQASWNSHFPNYVPKVKWFSLLKYSKNFRKALISFTFCSFLKCEISVVPVESNVLEKWDFATDLTGGQRDSGGEMFISEFKFLLLWHCLLQLWEYSALYWRLSTDLHLSASREEVSPVEWGPKEEETFCMLPFLAPELLRHPYTRHSSALGSGKSFSLVEKNSCERVFGCITSLTVMLRRLLEMVRSWVSLASLPLGSQSCTSIFSELSMTALFPGCLLGC